MLNTGWLAYSGYWFKNSQHQNLQNNISASSKWRGMRDEAQDWSGRWRRWWRGRYPVGQWTGRMDSSQLVDVNMSTTICNTRLVHGLCLQTILLFLPAPCYKMSFCLLYMATITQCVQKALFSHCHSQSFFSFLLFSRSHFSCLNNFIHLKYYKNHAFCFSLAYLLFFCNCWRIKTFWP
jgi:hypothetical protein